MKNSIKCLEEKQIGRVRNKAKDRGKTMTEKETKKERTPSFPLQLFRKKQRNEITQADFDKELAYWTFHTSFDEMKYIPMPIPPQEVKEYYSMNDYERSKLEKGFWAQEEVKLYFQLKREAEMENLSRRTGLEKLVDHIPREDEKNSKKVFDSLEEFKNRQRKDEELMKGYRSENNVNRPQYYEHGRGYIER